MFLLLRSMVLRYVSHLFDRLISLMLQNYVVSDSTVERDSYAQFLHPLFGVMTKWLGDVPRYDYTPGDADKTTSTAMQWRTGESEEKVCDLNCRKILNRVLGAKLLSWGLEEQS